MDYEKKYKEALVNMQELYNSMKYMSSTDALHTTTALERAFPELKSDDEKIRNVIILIIKGIRANVFEEQGITKEDAITYLEKQGEQKSTWNEDDERLCNASIRACQYMVENFENSTQDYEDAIDWLNSLKGRVQPQWKPSEEQMAHLVAAIEESDGNCILQSLYNDLKKL